MQTRNSRGGKHVRPGWRIPNGLYANRTHQLKNWVPLFLKEDGTENRNLAMKDFYRIWKNPLIKEVQLRGKLVLGGELYGYHGHHNGETFTTSYVTSIKRLTHGEPCANRFPRDVMCATTDTGETFFFNSDQFSLCVAVLLWDLENGNPLSGQEHFYVGPDYISEEFM